MVPLAAMVYDTANKCSFVTKISIGRITMGLRPPRHGKRVKMTYMERCILLIARDITSTQEVRVYATDMQKAAAEIALGLQKRGIGVSFRTDQV